MSFNQAGGDTIPAGFLFPMTIRIYPCYTLPIGLVLLVVIFLCTYSCSPPKAAAGTPSDSQYRIAAALERIADVLERAEKKSEPESPIY